MADMTWLIGMLLFVSHVAGIVTAVVALMSSRTSQGAVAWIVTLISFPYIAVPIFWTFGRPRFYGYVSARGERDTVLRQVLQRYRPQTEPYISRPETVSGRIRAVEELARMPMTRGNRAELLIDGDETFESLFNGIDRAETYILVQFFIVRADEIGMVFKRKLIHQAERGKDWKIIESTGG